MGVDVTVMTYIGIHVEDAEAYLIEKGILKEGQAEEEFDGDLKYAYESGKIPLDVQEVSYYSDEGQYVGFEVSPSDHRDLIFLITKFKEITGDDAEVCSFEHWW